MANETGDKIGLLVGIFLGLITALVFIGIAINIVGSEINAVEGVNTTNLSQIDTLLVCAEADVLLNCSTSTRFNDILFLTNSSINLTTTDYNITTNGTLCLLNATFNNTAITSNYNCEDDVPVNSTLIRFLGGLIVIIMVLIIIVALVVAVVLIGKKISE